jgi:hypothetical protein
VILLCHDLLESPHHGKVMTSLTGFETLGAIGSSSYSSLRCHLVDFLSVASSSKVTSLLISIRW